jgi:flagellar biosynthesis protein FliP
MIRVSKKHLRNILGFVCVLFVICILTFIFVTQVSAAEINTNDNATNTTTSTNNGNGTNTSDADVKGSIGPFQFNLDTGNENEGLSSTLQILLVLTLISLAPSLLIMVTSFTRILIVLHFVRSALGTQTTPPNQVLIGLALFLTFFIMSPVFTQINNNAIKPLNNGTITQEEALTAGMSPLREFMLEQVKPKDLKLFMNIAEIGTVESFDDIPTTVIIPAFIISELRTAFIIGFLIYIPFIVIDMVVASTLMSMGMMMLPPTTISMPFKILLFILADGWGLIVGELVKTFY